MKRIETACLIIGWAATVAAQEISVGSTEDEVLQALGEPQGRARRGEVEILFYDGGSVDIRQGRVVRLDPDFEARARQRREERAREAEMLAKGMVKYEDRWVTPAEKERLETEASARLKHVVVISDNGKRIDMDKLLVPGKITIVDFYADWCGPCRAISPHLEKMAAENTDVYLRKVNIVNWNSDVARQFNLEAIPNVRVFGRDGQMVGSPTHDLAEVRRNVAKAQ